MDNFHIYIKLPNLKDYNKKNYLTVDIPRFGRKVTFVDTIYIVILYLYIFMNKLDDFEIFTIVSCVFSLFLPLFFDDAIYIFIDFSFSENIHFTHEMFKNEKKLTKSSIPFHTFADFPCFCL